MVERGDEGLLPAALPEILRRLRARTPARLLQGRAGAAYRTETQLELREAYAAARDAVRVEFDATAIFGAQFISQWGLFEAATRAKTKDEFLRYPDPGRHFDDAARAEIARRCANGPDLQVAIGDGLSVRAVAAQVPPLLPLIRDFAAQRRWSFGRIFAIRHCRVGILNEIGEILAPCVVILLIGERPGLATAESLSAYMAYRPNAGHTDANRNLISNIHTRGLRPAEAAQQIVDLADRMRAAQISGWQLKTGDGQPNLASRDAQRHSYSSLPDGPVPDGQ
jgi:ethanolamine ammonia-lyase small subunit